MLEWACFGTNLKKIIKMDIDKKRELLERILKGKVSKNELEVNLGKKGIEVMFTDKVIDNGNGTVTVHYNGSDIKTMSRAEYDNLPKIDFTN